jgi:hypothetical protein
MDNFVYDLGTAVAQFAVTLCAIAQRWVALAVKRVIGDEEQMPSHKFHVTIQPVVSRNVPGGVYEITKQLPETGREFEYRTITEPESER